MENHSNNTALYQKMQAEFEYFKDWLLNQPPQEILNHAYEYTTKEDILLTFENFDLSEKQAKALLSQTMPLDDVFLVYDKTESDLIETLQNCMKSRADAILSEQQWNVPVYMQNAAYAREHDELEEYRDSNKENVNCKYSIEAAIKDHYNDNCLDVSCAKDIIAAYGIERVQTVLAATIRAIDWDGRISGDNKTWAKRYPIPDDSTIEFHVNGCHRGLIDLFCTEVRRLQREMEKKPSLLEKLSSSHAQTSPQTVSKSKKSEISR